MKLQYKFSTIIIVFYFVNMIVLSNGSLAAKIGKLFFAMIAVVYLVCIKKSVGVNWKKLELWLLGYTAYACVSIGWAYSRSYAINGIKTILLNSFCVFLLIHVLMASKEWKGTVIRVVAICPLILFLRLFLQYGFTVFGGLRNLGTGIHNSTGMYAALGCVFGIYYSMQYENRKVCWRVVIFIDFLLVLLSMSRKAVIYLMAPIVLCYLLTGNNISKKIKNFFILILILICFWLAIMKIPVLYQYIGQGIESVLGYMKEGTGDISAAGRNTRIAFGLEQFYKRPWFGWGAMNYNKLFGDFQTGMDMVIADNNFIDVLVNFGLIGFFVYYYIYIEGTVLYMSLQQKNTLNQAAPYALLITLLICDYGVSAYIYLYSQTFIALCVGTLIDNKQREKLQQKQVKK